MANFSCKNIDLLYPHIVVPRAPTDFKIVAQGAADQPLTKGSRWWNVYAVAIGTIIDHFTVACLVPWPWIGSEAGADLVLIRTNLTAFSCKCKLVSIRTA